MKKEAKIHKLREWFLTGAIISPLDAWESLGMAQNTFNRQVWELKNKHNLSIQSRPIKLNGKTIYCAHWVQNSFPI